MRVHHLKSGFWNGHCANQNQKHFFGGMFQLHQRIYPESLALGRKKNKKIKSQALIILRFMENEVETAL